MSLTVKKVRALPTDDGLAYECTVYWKGKRVGTAENDGLGGEDTFAIADNIIAEINAYGRTLPPIKFDDADIADDPIYPDIGILVGRAVVEFEGRRALARLLKKYFVMVNPDSGEALRARRIDPATGADRTQSLVNSHGAKFPSHKILNVLSDDEAYALALKADLI